MKACFSAILLFSGLYAKIALAQHSEGIPDDFKFKHFTSANGLSQRSVMAILQDKKGYLWFGTRDGLNRFDGNKFIVYRHYSTDSTSLSNNNIHVIYEDSYGNLWVGTHIGLNKYNPKTDNFIRYGNTDLQPRPADHIIRGIAQVSTDLLWAATDNGILQINLKTDETKRIKKLDDNPQSLSDNKTRYFLKTDNDNVWICNTRYIDVYNLRQKTFRRIDYPKKNSSEIHLNDLPTLYVDQKKTMWLGYEKGLAVFDSETGSFVDFEFQNKKPITSAVRSICEDLDGNLWIGSYSGLYILNAERAELRHIVHDEDNSASLSQNSIYKIIRDSRGDMWLGTWADGLNYYNRDNGAFKQFSFGNTHNKLNYRVVSGIAEDANGNLWIGTEGGGLNFYDKKTKKFTYYKNDPADKYSLSANNVKSVIIDHNQHIWIGIHDGGLNFLDPSRKPFKFQRIDFSDENNLSLKAYKVLTLLEDRQGNIWIGTLTGGLIFYDVHTKQLSKIDKDIKSIMSIEQSENPDVLLLGGDNGLETINILTKERNQLPLKTDLHTPPLNVNCIFVDNFNNYWIGTEGQGVFMYDPKRKKTVAYGVKEGLPNDIIYGILSDNNGNIWMSTNNGLSRLNITSNDIKNYNQADGLQGNEFNYGSFYKTKDNRLLFGGTNGLTYFDPNDIRKNSFTPTIDITRIAVNNAPYAKITDAVSRIALKHNENNFSIDFTALSYMQPEKNEFAYMLEGYDRKWNYVGNQRTAIYTNIEAGNYVFRVRGANNDGVWNETGDSIAIRVLPAPWRTWWAYCFYLVTLGGVFLYIRKLMLLRIKERKEKEKSDQINQLRLSLFTDVSHEFRTPLTLIVGPLEKMVGQRLGDGYIRQQHEIMLKNAKMLLQLINQILDFRKSEVGKLALRASKNNIVPFVADIKKSFDALAEKKGINYQLITGDSDIQVWFDKSKLKNILFNLLANAFKFSDDHSEVTIHLSTTSKKRDSHPATYVEIGVTNFGPVIPEGQIRRIFDPFHQLDHGKMNLGSGIGLTLTKRLVELHKGEITVKSSITGGTRFDVLLPLGRDHLSKNECFEDSEDSFDGDSFIFDAPIEKPENPPAATSHDEALQNLLIVEDNVDLLNFIKEIFINKYNIFIAQNGEQAIAIAREQGIDLIISDIQMPVMNGFELCHNIKTTLLTSHIPVILLTAKTSPVHQEKGYLVGADAYITKPFDANILAIRATNLLNTRANLIRKFKQDVILEPKNLTITSPDEQFLKNAIAIVEQHITDPDFNASVFIDQMNMSRTVIYTKLKALTGQNISTFIRTIRLKKAGLMIVQTDLNISQIAYEVGFNDLKYFRDSFKELFKMTPTEYKKRSVKEKRP
ncbi:Two component regulator propeller [Parapedobacter composti]|uniref:histidine kinase n=1 Tax=Parapedobacter composti TaxID=623281 RepID=A0A1I1FN43_9SPHI|nr:hybrid sensor histidine kinase/response regulator transcription factor [Parapedobacter composti]SFC00711.1 Two component regulator propeller [Parapedobacter composti]